MEKRWVRVGAAGIFAAMAFLVACGDDAGSGGSCAGGSGGSPTGGAAGDGGTGGAVGGQGGGGQGGGGQGGEGGSVVDAPQLDSLTPDSGIVTTDVVVAGSGFGATQGASTITIGGTAVTPSSWADDAIAFTVPDTIFPGDADVVVTVAAQASNALAFDVRLPRTVYLNNDDDVNSVSAFAMDAAGALTALTGSPYTTGELSAGFGGDSSSITLHRGTRRLFASNDTSVAVYDIDGVTGELTAVGGSPFATGGTAAYGVEVNAAGTRLFVANYDSDTVTVFDVAANGTMTQVAGSPFSGTTTGGMDTPSLLNNGSLLAVTDEQSLLSVFTVNAGTGALAEVAGSPFTLGGYTFTSKQDPSGTYLFVPDTDNDALQVFTFDASGAPTQIPSSPFSVTITGSYVHGLAFTPDGGRLYMGTYVGDEIFAFDLAAGAPTQIAGSPFAAPSATGTSALEVTRDGDYLVAVQEDDLSINVFSLAADGTPTAVSGSPFAIDVATASPSGLVIGE